MIPYMAVRNLFFLKNSFLLQVMPFGPLPVLGPPSSGAFAPAPMAPLKKRPCAGVFGVYSAHPEQRLPPWRLRRQRPLKRRSAYGRHRLWHLSPLSPLKQGRNGGEIAPSALAPTASAPVEKALRLRAPPPVAPFAFVALETRAEWRGKSAFAVAPSAPAPA